MYPDELKIACLQAQELGLSVKEIAEQYQVKPDILYHWFNPNKPVGINSYHLKKLREEREPLADRLEYEVNAALDHAETVRPSARYSEVALMLKSAVPLMRLLRNESTANIAVATEEERNLRLLELVEAAKQRRIEAENDPDGS